MIIFMLLNQGRELGGGGYRIAPVCALADLCNGFEFRDYFRIGKTLGWGDIFTALFTKPPAP